MKSGTLNSILCDCVDFKGVLANVAVCFSISASAFFLSGVAGGGSCSMHQAIARYCWFLGLTSRSRDSYRFCKSSQLDSSRCFLHSKSLSFNNF